VRVRLNRCLLLWLQAAPFSKHWVLFQEEGGGRRREEEDAGCVLPLWKHGPPFSSWPILLSSCLFLTVNFLLSHSSLVTPRVGLHLFVSPFFLLSFRTPVDSGKPEDLHYPSQVKGQMLSQQLPGDVSASLPGLRCPRALSSIQKTICNRQGRRLEAGLNGHPIFKCQKMFLQIYVFILRQTFTS